MSWNYRIVRYRSSGAFGLHEVYYNRAGEPVGMTQNPASFGADEDEGAAGIIEGLRLALKDAETRPVLAEPETWAKWDDETDGELVDEDEL